MEAHISSIIAGLERTPGVLRPALTGIPDELLRGTEGGESWSPLDVVGHLIHGERTDWIPHPAERRDRPRRHRYAPGAGSGDGWAAAGHLGGS